MSSLRTSGAYGRFAAGKRCEPKARVRGRRPRPRRPLLVHLPHRVCRLALHAHVARQLTRGLSQRQPVFRPLSALSWVGGNAAELQTILGAEVEIANSSHN